jgi:hypothetical protein
MRKRAVTAVLVLPLLAGLGACDRSEQPSPATPELAPRGTAMTTAKPTRQDLANRLSLSGQVTLDPVFGLVAPVGGQVRFRTVSAPRATPTKPTRVASIWAGGKRRDVFVPAGAIFTGRLVDDRSTVVAGVPIVSAKHVGYGIVADIDGTQAYKISDSLGSVQAQIKGGPGPFGCRPKGTVAALPAGVIPDPPAPPAPPAPSPMPPGPIVIPPVEPGPGLEPSEPTGLRLVCVPPANVKMINGASATLEVITDRVKNALVLPVEAVAGLQGRGQVEVVKPDGTREIRAVTLGLTDGKVIQIRSGLAEDETVSVPGPNLPAAPPQRDEVGGPVVFK